MGKHHHNTESLKFEPSCVFHTVFTLTTDVEALVEWLNVSPSHPAVEVGDYVLESRARAAEYVLSCFAAYGWTTEWKSSLKYQIPVLQNKHSVFHCNYTRLTELHEDI